MWCSSLQYKQKNLLRKSWWWTWDLGLSCRPLQGYLSSKPSQPPRRCLPCSICEPSYGLRFSPSSLSRPPMSSTIPGSMANSHSPSCLTHQQDFPSCFWNKCHPLFIAFLTHWRLPSQPANPPPPPRPFLNLTCGSASELSLGSLLICSNTYVLGGLDLFSPMALSTNPMMMTPKCIFPVSLKLRSLLLVYLTVNVSESYKLNTSKTKFLICTHP